MFSIQKPWLFYFLLLILASQSSTLASNDGVVSAWIPPVGIPAPSFGVEETYLMYDDPSVRNPELTYQASYSGGYFTHYVDSTDPNATDSGNPCGSVFTPRITVPRDLPAGSVVEIHNGANANGWGEFNTTGVGTKDSPIFVRGIGLPRIPIRLDIGFYGNTQYIIVEGISFFCGGVYGRQDGTAFENSYIAVRNCEFMGDSNNGGFGTASWTDNKLNNIVFYNNTVHDNGIWDPEVAEGDRDIGGIAVKGNVGHIWILDNEMYHNEYDGIQVGGTDVVNFPHNIFIARNVSHHNKQSGFGLKTAEDVIFSENIAYGQRSSSSASGTGMGFQYDPKRVWYLFNYIYDCQDGIACGSGNLGGREEFYFIGNLICDCLGDGFQFNGLNPPEPAMVLLNTIYNCPDGIANGYYDSKVSVLNNIIAGYTHAINFGDTYKTYQISDMDYNLLDGSGDIVWGSIYADLTSFQVGTEHGQHCIEADPMFVDPANGDFNLQPASPINNIATSEKVQAVFDRFLELYGIDLSEDIAGVPRTAVPTPIPDDGDTSPPDNLSDSSSETATSTGISAIADKTKDKVKVRTVFDRFGELYSTNIRGQAKKEYFE